jgi:hypothetical protein
MYCCQPFENAIGAAGGRGLAILVERTRKGIAFAMQSRGISHHDVDHLRPPPVLATTINVSSESRIKYCPWCGRCLQDLALAAPSHFAQLAEQHKALLSAPSEV